VDAASLQVLGAALRSGRDGLHEMDDAAPLALWEAMIELADVRAEMLVELRRGTPEAKCERVSASERAASSGLRGRGTQ
jgi:hypothetical protein